MKINPSRIGDITLLFTDIGKSCPASDFFTSQMSLLTLFAKIKFSRKFPNLQYLKVALGYIRLREREGEREREREREREFRYI